MTDPIPSPYSAPAPHRETTLLPHSPSSFSPTRPPVSPITPPLVPDDLQLLQSAAAPLLPPPPEPLDWETNSDAVAVRSALAILQLQRRRAVADIDALARARAAALADPAAFVSALSDGRARARPGRVASLAPADADADADADAAAGPWHALPTQQAVVRCPPVNWAQYAVVGESLDRLHAEQLARPSAGAPATYVFPATADGAQSPSPPYLGVAAPYAPERDRIEQKHGRGPAPRR